ncbi:SDR family NAD(P)-dependent oxidoreductase [Campylobacter sp. VBCF_05 NA6]|uniref:SDR family NAD(P)-dependent oxidoreductase n=1 Tax=unclassified Campylobacter TaxID=2593542 RepID=UPI0022E9EB79|nr:MULTISPECIES: SDR family NAD(P)-dependent oxidoreductase [unclassified Campylobacter]MDA3057738.1 SDR family NAD(P)-dependent oxidoreductase [Campylobacter sp. VBCF_04 NA7]MDA3058888.1 SDR family NAD(P)-dependent oxidoreductase [Campylobacter sp. VBCF_05 NA6]
MKKALITGAGGGIGSAIARKFSQNGFEIVTLNSRFEDTASLKKELANLSKESFDAVILCAGVGNFDPFEAVSGDEISRVISVNLSANLIILNALINSLKRSHAHIIGIASIEAHRHSRFSALYSASKAGLRAFLLCLFEEYRKDLRVTCISPDMTQTPFFADLRFEPGSDERAYIDPDEIANFAYEAYKTKSNLSEIVIRPRIVGIKKKN